jgi:hypothetical protein
MVMIDKNGSQSVTNFLGFRPSLEP